MIIIMNTNQWDKVFEEMKTVLGDFPASNYLSIDADIDIAEIQKLPTECKFIWLIRDDGTDLINISLPRSFSHAENVANMDLWKKAFVISNTGLKNIELCNIISTVKSEPKYNVTDCLVSDLSGYPLAHYITQNGVKYGEYDVKIGMSLLNWDIKNGFENKVDVSQLYLAERAILDHMISKHQSMFIKTNNLFLINMLSRTDQFESYVPSSLIEKMTTDSTPVILGVNSETHKCSANLPCLHISDAKEFFLPIFKNIIKKDNDEKLKFFVLESTPSKEKIKKKIRKLNLSDINL